VRRALAIAVSLQAGIARAQEPADEVARRELIAQAEDAAAAGEHARALDLARRANALRPSASLTYFLAREHRALDQRVDALDLARACLRAAQADAALRNRDTILQACEAVRASVEPRVGRVVVRVPADAPAGLTVRVGGRAVLPALWGVAFPVMPGALDLVAAAPGFAPLSRTLDVAEGALAEADIALTPETPAPPPTPALPPPTPAPPRIAPSVTRSQPAGPWVVAGFGVAGFALAGVFYGIATSARTERDAACVTAGCADIAQAHDARYADMLTATNVALGVGGAAVAGAVAWFLVARLRGAPPAVALAPQGLRLAF